MSDSDKFRYAGFWSRVVASLIDGVLMMLLLLPFSSLLFDRGIVYAEDVRWGQDASSQLLQTLFMAAFILLFWIYRSATPGKMIFGMRIVDAKSGGKPSIIQLLIRYLGYYVSLIPFGFGFFWIAFDDKKQGFHDKIARTLVVR